MQSSLVHSVQTADFEMEYVVFGHGARPLVILPGVSLKSVMLSAEALEGGFQLFVEDWTVYVFDRKKNITPGYSVEQMADDTAAAMMQLGLSGADVFGASQGGMIAQYLALNHPTLVHALYLGSTMSRNNAQSMQNLRRWIDLAKGDDVVKLNRAFFQDVYSPEFYRQYQDVFANLEQDGTREEMDRLAILVEACLGFDVYDRLPELRCPVFVVGSRVDRVLTGEASEEIAQKLHCPLYLYDGYGHAVYDEAPDYRGRMKEALLSVR